MNREYDEELELVSEELARMEEEERLMRLENAEDPTLATQEASSGSEEPAQEARGRRKVEPVKEARGGRRAGKEQLEVPSRRRRWARNSENSTSGPGLKEAFLSSLNIPIGTPQ